MAGAGRELWKPSSPAPLLRRVHLKQVAQNHVQAGFETLQRRRLHNLSGQRVPDLCQPQSTVFPRVWKYICMELVKNLTIFGSISAVINPVIQQVKDQYKNILLGYGK